MLADSFPTNHHTNSTQDLFLSKNEYYDTRSQLMDLAEDANKFSYAINFDGLDEMITEHQHQSCSHHMNSCARQEDWLYELSTLMRAIESSTRQNSISIIVTLLLQ